MASYEGYGAREAEYERRKAAGEIGGNPLAGSMPDITDISKILQLASNPAAALPDLGGAVVEKLKRVAELPQVQDVMDTMKANVAEHPIYKGAGENLGEDIIYDKVDAITGEERDSPNIVNIPGIPENASTSIVDGVASSMEKVANMGTPDLTPVDIQGKRKEGGPPTPKEQEAQSKVIEKEAIDAIKASGASEEEVDKMGKFMDQFDMTTFGMALLAGGNAPLGQSIGKAMIAARGAKSAQDASAAAGAAAGRAEGRDERKVAATEYNAITSRLAEERQSRGGVKPTPAHNEVARAFLTNNDQYKLADSDGGLDSLSVVMAENLAEAEYINSLLPPEQQRTENQMNHIAATQAIARIGWVKQERMYGLRDPVYGNK